MVVRRPTSAGGSQGRPAGSVDLAPRAPRRGLPAATPITFQPDNPHRGGTAAYARYDLYKGAQSVGAARELGATSQDLKGDLEKEYARLQ